MRTEENTKFVPQLRFPEFLGAPGWTPKELGDCLDYLQPTQYLVSSTAYNDNYQIPVVTAGKTFILGYTNETEGVFKQPLPVIIFDDFTTASQFVNFPFKAKSSAMKILLAKKNSNIKFVYESMQGIEYEVGAHGRHWISTYSKIELAVPELIEQQKIADCLSSLDELIAAQGRKVEALKTHKKGLMQQLFPREGETQPRLRFPEFQNTMDWSEGKLEDIATVWQGYGFPERFQGQTSGDYPFYKVSDISRSLAMGDVFIKESANFVNEDLLKELRAKPIPTGTTIFAKIGEAIRSNKRAVTTAPCLIDNNAAGLKRIDGKATDLFIYFLMEQISLIDHAGGVVPSVNKSAIESIAVRFPCPNEQQRIADCLTSLDASITAATQELDTIRAHKKGLMQQLFPSMERSYEFF